MAEASAMPTGMNVLHRASAPRSVVGLHRADSTSGPVITTSR